MFKRACSTPTPRWPKPAYARRGCLFGQPADAGRRRGSEGDPMSVRVAGSAGVAGQLRIRMRGVHALCGLTMLTCAGPSPAPPRSATANEDGGDSAARQQEVRPKQRLRSLAGGLTRRQWNTLIDRCCGGGPDGELTMPDFKRLLMLSMVPTAQVSQWTDNEIVELWLHLRSIAQPEEFTSNGGQGGERTGRQGGDGGEGTIRRASWLDFLDRHCLLGNPAQSSSVVAETASRGAAAISTAWLPREGCARKLRRLPKELATLDVLLRQPHHTAIASAAKPITSSSEAGRGAGRGASLCPDGARGGHGGQGVVRVGEAGGGLRDVSRSWYLIHKYLVIDRSIDRKIDPDGSIDRCLSISLALSLSRSLSLKHTHTRTHTHTHTQARKSGRAEAVGNAAACALSTHPQPPPPPPHYSPWHRG
jgi:hypothetical protein